MWEFIEYLELRIVENISSKHISHINNEFSYVVISLMSPLKISCEYGLENCIAK